MTEMERENLTAPEGYAGGDTVGEGTERAKRAFLANLRHELRTPINAIIGYSELLMEDAEDLDQEWAVQDLRDTHSAGRKLLGIVNDILDPGKIESVRDELDLEAFGDELRHALRTPLNDVIGLSEMMLEEAEEQSQEDFIPDLKKIKSAGWRFLELIDDLVKLSTNEEEAVKKDLENSEASIMVQEVIGSIRPLTGGDDDNLVTARGGSLLVVDDNEMNRDLLSRHLQRQGHTVSVAENGRQALGMLENCTFDLLLLDVMMPEMNGYQVLAHMKSAENLRHIPVIMISALDEMDSVVRCIELGAEDYLPKPCNPVLLKARLDTCLEKKRLRDKEKLYTQSMERELEIGREIQKSFLPDDLPQPPGWEITAHFQAAHQVAGDFYDVFPIPGGQGVGLVIADVCDKGVGAALFMGLFRSLIRAFAEMHYSGDGTSLQGREAAGHSHPDPKEAETEIVDLHDRALRGIIGQTNDYIALNHGRSNMFATMFLGVLDPASNILVYIPGGHVLPILFGPNGVRKRLEPTGPAVGLMPGMPFETGRIRFEPEDTLLAFTDGVTEARALNSELYGEDRLIALLREPAASAGALMERVLTDLDHHTAGADRWDDTTLLAVRRSE